MDRVERICAHCGVANPADARFCGACATALRPVTGTALATRPAPLATTGQREAAAAVAVGVAALVGRAVLALARNPDLLQSAWRTLRREQPEPEPAAPLVSPPAGRRTVIRRRWAVGDSFGTQRWGTEEIEIHHPEG